MWRPVAAFSSSIASLPDTRKVRRIDPLDQTLLLVELVADLADQLFQQVLERHQSRGAAVLVHHDRQVDLLGLELPQAARRRASISGTK